MPYFIVVLLCLTLEVFAAPVDHNRILAADNEPGSWLSHGRTYAEDRESPLTGITPDNVAELGLTWYFDTGTRRGLEASPLVIDGIIYTTGSWSRVYAIDARNGSLLWDFDPKVPRAWGANACCDVVNRGVAAWDNNIYLGTLDGRLIALNRFSGEIVWEQLTIDPEKPYTITGAPRAINGKIMIGNGGAEYGVRGYISAYDAITGDLNWRFFTVPGDPGLPPESDAIAMAAKTWTGEVYWKVGGGGTVWDSMAYDPDLNLLYFGVGNGSPWNRNIRSPLGGDNLFLSSIVAVNADTGEYVWHYQTTPADSYDYTATQHMILADLDIHGVTRKVIMQAPKNGFFYILDRRTGEFLSAEKYTYASWASHVDPESGRPIETPEADHSIKEKIIGPAPFGGHNWQPMAFNHQQKLVYIPAMESMSAYSTAAKFNYHPGSHWNTAQAEVSDNAGMMINLPPELAGQVIRRMFKGRLIAWDPIEQKESWAYEHKTMWNGGLLTTASGLVFQGTGDGRFIAFRADNGEVLWEADTGTGIIAPPVSYSIDGEQYIALMAGWGGAAGLTANLPGAVAGGNGRMLVYKLGGTSTLPIEPVIRKLPKPPAARGTEASLLRGVNLYNQHCLRCHGASVMGGGVISDLRYMSEASHELFQQIVRGGLFKELGMISFADVLSEKDAEDIHHYIIHTANLQWEENQSSDWWVSVRNWSYDIAADLLTWIQKQ